MGPGVLNPAILLLNRLTRGLMPKGNRAPNNHDNNEDKNNALCTSKLICTGQ